MGHSLFAGRVAGCLQNHDELSLCVSKYNHTRVQERLVPEAHNGGIMSVCLLNYISQTYQTDYLCRH